MARRWLILAPLVVVLVWVASGCGGRAPREPEAKLRLEKLLRLYQLYQERNRKAPVNEEALRAFAARLSAKERDEYLIGDDLETIYTSPRDGQPFVVRYNLEFDPGEQTRAIAWEAVGKGGMRFVALSLGYVEEYDEETFRQYR